MNFNLALSVLAAVSAVSAYPGENLEAAITPTLRGNKGETRDLKAAIKDDDASWTEKLGVCTKGANCGMWGDPHVVTCDGLAYDCQAIGIVTVMKNHLYNMQTNFVDIGAMEKKWVQGWRLTEGATIINDFMVDFVPNDDVPIVQLGFGEIKFDGIPSERGCGTYQKLYPENMEGQDRSTEASVQDCRKRCEGTTGCTRFQYYVDGGCHMNNDDQQVRTASRWGTKVLYGRLVDDCGKPVPDVELDITDVEVDKHGTIGNNCPLLMYLDGELQDISEKATNGNGYLWGAEGDDHYVRMSKNKLIHIVNKVEGGQFSEIQLHLKGKGPGEKWSCHWDFYVCLPESESQKLEKYSVGLLGSPDGNPQNDWMDRENEVLTIQNSKNSQGHKAMIDYCYDNWCVSQEESIMSYYGDTTYEDHKCLHEEFIDFDINSDRCDLPAEKIRFACKDVAPLLRYGCHVDCCYGGCDEIPDNKIEDIIKLSDKEEDSVISIPIPDECDDTQLLSTSSTACPNAAEPIVKLVQQSGAQALPEDAEIFYDIVISQEDKAVPTVTFKVNNPFTAIADIYVKHDKQALSTFIAPTCDSNPYTGPGCNDSQEITVACHDFQGIAPFALVQVYFASVAVDANGEQATIDKCCHAEEFESGVGIVEYTFEVKCACPEDRIGGNEPVRTYDPTQAPTRAPTREPTKTPTITPTVTVTDVAAPPETDCEGMEGLTLGFSAATGDDQWSDKCYPPVTQLQPNNLPGRDDSVAVFVGGNYDGINGAEVEGNMVVLGDLRVRNNGPANFVSVGGGTHVVPNNGGDCIVVGGDLSAGSRNIQVFNQAHSMNCDIVYKGNGASTWRWKTFGDVKHEPNYDMSRYEETKATLYKKSQYWKTLPSTGTMDYKPWGEGQTSYLCNNKDEIQVFNIQPHQRNWLKSVDTIKFGDDCEGKTILINVQGTGSVDAKAAAMHFKNKKGYGKNGFPTCMTESILWNFPDAADVNIGAGRSSEWHGSVLVGGNLKLTTTGQSGRTMVLGNIVQNRAGSEFHSYQYNPPMSLPDPSDLCVDGDKENDALPLGAMTSPPTDEVVERQGFQ